MHTPVAAPAGATLNRAACQSNGPTGRTAEAWQARSAAAADAGQPSSSSNSITSRPEIARSSPGFAPCTRCVHNGSPRAKPRGDTPGHGASPHERHRRTEQSIAAERKRAPRSRRKETRVYKRQPRGDTAATDDSDRFTRTEANGAAGKSIWQNDSEQRTCARTHAHILVADSEQRGTHVHTHAR